MRELLEFIVKAIVDAPDKVVITEETGEQGVVFKLQVADEDKGRVIGKQGRIVAPNGCAGSWDSHCSAISQLSISNRRSSTRCPGSGRFHWSCAVLFFSRAFFHFSARISSRPNSPTSAVLAACCRRP